MRGTRAAYEEDRRIYGSIDDLRVNLRYSTATGKIKIEERPEWGSYYTDYRHAFPESYFYAPAQFECKMHTNENEQEDDFTGDSESLNSFLKQFSK